MEAKEQLYKLISLYFVGATVYWSDQKMAKPNPPAVMLKMTSAAPKLFPIQQVVDGIPVSYYPTTAPLEINLYAKGPKTQGYKMTNMSNPAVNDMTEFLKFLGSDYALDWMECHDLSLLPVGPIRNVDAVLNNVRNENRAMLEFSAEFMDEAWEVTGIAAPPGSAWQQTVSGGGSEALAAEKAGWFNSVEFDIDTSP